MGWAGLLKAVLGLFTLLAGLFRDRQLRQDGVQAQVVQDQKETLDEVLQATDARAAVERDAALRPDSVFEDDGFRRP